jgi:hypothetical protein
MARMVAKQLMKKDALVSHVRDDLGILEEPNRLSNSGSQSRTSRAEPDRPGEQFCTALPSVAA